jgi:hypothetical protein
MRADKPKSRPNGFRSIAFDRLSRVPLVSLGRAADGSITRTGDLAAAIRGSLRARSRCRGET